MNNIQHKNQKPREKKITVQQKPKKTQQKNQTHNKKVNKHTKIIEIGEGIEPPKKSFADSHIKPLCQPITQKKRIHRKGRIKSLPTKPLLYC